MASYDRDIVFGTDFFLFLCSATDFEDKESLYYGSEDQGTIILYADDASIHSCVEPTYRE